jgi:tyrosinase
VETGIHGGGHGFIGGLNADLFVSAGDPLFYMHHTMLDRVWAIWQGLDFDTRVYKDALDGTRTMLNGEYILVVRQRRSAHVLIVAISQTRRAGT